MPPPPPPPRPLAICDKAAEVPQALDKSVLSKIDDGLNWWKSLREQARKSLEKGEGPACAALKLQLHQKLKDMFAWQTQLEEMKMFGTVGNSQNVKAVQLCFGLSSNSREHSRPTGHGIGCAQLRSKKESFLCL